MKAIKLEVPDFDRELIPLCCVLLVLSVVLFYDQTFQFGFTLYDDSRVIREQPQLFAFGSVQDRLNQILFLDYPREEPLIVRDFSWLLDSVAFGFGRPFGYHFGNVVYHALTILIAFVVFRRLIGPKAALLATVLISMLAVHVEPVAWMMGRKDILSTLFCLLSIYFLVRFRESSMRSPKLWVYFASLLFACAAYLSKVNTVVLPGVLLICGLITDDGFCKQGFKAPGFGIRFQLLVMQLLPFLASGLIVFLWYQSVLEDFGLLSRFAKYSGEDLLRVLFVVNPLILINYLKIIVLPDQLSAYYTTPSIYQPFTPGDIALAVSMILLSIAAVVVLWRVNRIACLLVVCFFILMLPYANWVHQGFWYANRYVYFSSMVLVAAFSHVAMSLFRVHQRIVSRLTVGAVIAVVLGANLDYRSEYVRVWEDGIKLWSYEISLPDASIHAYNNLASTYIGYAEDILPLNDELASEREVLLEKALDVNNQVLQLHLTPRDSRWLAVSNYHRGLILSYLGAPLESQLASFLNAVEISPDYSDALWSVAWNYYQLALREEDVTARLQLAHKALTFFNSHFELSEMGARSVNRRTDMMNRLENDFPELRTRERGTTLNP